VRPHGGPAAVVALLTLALAGPPAAWAAGTEGARGTGSIAGQVILAGPPPVVAAVAVGKHRWFCGETRLPASLRLGPGGAVAGALVILEGDGLPAAAGPGRAHLDNRDCEFAPRVQVASVGSELEVLTSDPILHTAHAYLDGRDTLFHVALPVFLSRRVVRLERPGLVTIECDAGHTWMRAFIWVTATGFATVTDAVGRFRLAGIPPGRYRVRVRHEVLGERVLPVEAEAGHEARLAVRYGREP
jgi:carboxypeptidase family protein